MTTPATVLAEALLHVRSSGFDYNGTTVFLAAYVPGSPYAVVSAEQGLWLRMNAAILAALPEGWRLTNEPELTEKRLATAIDRYALFLPSASPPRPGDFSRTTARALLAALKEAKP